MVQPGNQLTNVPKPTYLTSSKAVPSNRLIDLTVPGAWSAAQQAEADLFPGRDEIFDQEVAENAAEKKFGAVNE